MSSIFTLPVTADLRPHPNPVTAGLDPAVHAEVSHCAASRYSSEVFDEEFFGSHAEYDKIDAETV